MGQARLLYYGGWVIGQKNKILINYLVNFPKEKFFIECLIYFWSCKDWREDVWIAAWDIPLNWEDLLGDSFGLGSWFFSNWILALVAFLKSIRQQAYGVLIVASSSGVGIRPPFSLFWHAWCMRAVPQNQHTERVAKRIFHGPPHLAHLAANLPVPYTLTHANHVKLEKQTGQDEAQAWSQSLKHLAPPSPAELAAVSTAR